jgi:hypothetical protein
MVVSRHRAGWPYGDEHGSNKCLVQENLQFALVE